MGSTVQVSQPSSFKGDENCRAETDLLTHDTYEPHDVISYSAAHVPLPHLVILQPQVRYIL